MTATLRFVALLALALGAAAQGESGREPPNNKGQQQSGVSESPQRPPSNGRKPPVGKQGGPTQQMFQLSSGGFNIEANGNGNVPFYRYWADGDQANTVKIVFERMFQTTNPDDPAAGTKLKRVNLVSGYSWMFSDATEKNTSGTTTEVIFNMTGVARTGGPADAPKPGITFVNHLVSNGNGTELKFDVLITGFLASWWDSSATHLVTAYKVLNEPPTGGVRNVSLGDMRVQRAAQRPSRPCPDDQPTCGEGAATAVEFGNGNGIEAVVTADGGTGTANVECRMTVGTDGPEEERPEEGGGSFLYISYAKFDTDLRHDPTVYNQDTSSASISVPSSQTIYDDDGNPVYVDGASVDPATGEPEDSAASGLSAAVALRMGAALAAMALLAVLF